MRRALKISAWVLGSLLTLVVVVLVAVLIIGNTQSGRAFIVRLTSRITGGEVQIAGIGGSFPQALDLDSLRLSDEHGVWLSAAHISLRWSPMALLSRHVLVDALHIGNLHIERAPVSKPKTESSGPVSLPHADVNHLDIDTLELGPSLAGAATSLVVHANAHWISMQDAVANLAAQRTGGAGNYQAQLRFDADRMDVTLKLREPAHGPLENLLSMPGLGDLSVSGQLSGPRTAENLQLTLEAGALQGHIRGSINLPAMSADLNYALSASEMTPHPGLTWQRVNLQGSWQGTVSAPSANGRLDVQQLQIPGGTQLAHLNADLNAAGGLLTARAKIEGLVVPGSEPTLFRDTPLALDASVHLKDSTRPIDISASHRLFALRAHAITVGKRSAHLELRLPDLAPLARLAGQKINGDATLRAQISYDAPTTQLTADADANLDGGNASWAGLFRGQRTRLQLAGKADDKKISIDKLDLTAKAINLGANGSVARSATQDLDARLNLSLPELAQLSPTLDGSLKLSGRVNGPSTALNTVADLTSTLSIRGSPKGTVSASVHADGLPKEPHGTVEAHGDLDGAPLQLHVSLDRAAGSDALHAVIHRADWKSAHIEGDLTSSPQIARTRGGLRLRMTQLADLDRLLGSTLAGSVTGDVKLTPQTGPSRAQVGLEIHDLTTGGLTANAKLAASGTLDSLAMQLDAESPAIGGKPASVTSSLILNTDRHELRLNSIEAHYQEQTVKLLSPSTLTFANGLSIRDLKLGAQQAVLDVDGDISPTLDVRVSLQQLKPELINAFAPGLLAAGTIQANAQLKGTTSAPTGKVHLDATGLRGANDAARGLPATDIHADTQLMGDTALVDVKLSAGSGSHLALTGHAPISATGALDLKLGGNLNIGILNPITEASGRHVAGTVTLETSVTGTAAAPEIGGTVRLADGSVRDYTQGINLTNITGDLTGSHGTLQIQKLTARAAPGNVTISGTIGVLQPHVPVDIKLTAKNAQPIASNIVTANLNADIQVSGSARDKLDVSGKVTVNRATVQIPSGFPPNVAVLDVRRPGEAPPPKPEKPLVIGLDVTLDAPRQVLVKGRGLDAELGGEIHVRGTTDDPQVTGSFDLQRGTFTLGNSQLTFSQGTVTFNGEGLAKKIDPTLDFVAQTQVQTQQQAATVTVKISGLADSPEIELSSPDLPQDEILAYLLFGTSTDKLTALQAVQMGAALSQLTGGGGGGLNPLDKIQKSLGLDKLTVGSSGTGPGGATSGTSSQQNAGYSVEAGRYVSSRVFVAVKQSTTGASQLQVDVDLTKNLKLQTRLGNGSTSAQGTTPENDPGSSVGLAYQFEY